MPVSVDSTGLNLGFGEILIPVSDVSDDRKNGTRIGRLIEATNLVLIYAIRHQ
jgi:hypothetical protein